MTYFFILGNNPTLSIAEIFQTVPHGAKIIKISSEILFLETRQDIDIPNLQKRLGGTIKIGMIRGKMKTVNKPFLVNQIVKLLSKKPSKTYFGFSVYSLNSGIDIRNFERHIKDIAIRVKRELRTKNISSRWVTSRQFFLSSVIVKKNNLIKKGAEIVFLINKNAIWFGNTIAVQSFEEYEFFDFSRPARLIKKGMLPPKLAKIMVNLSFKNKIIGEKVILDPFCGVGTILQEAILMGCKNTIGTDVSEKAIGAIKQNMDWLENKYKVKDIKYKISQLDVRNLSKKILSQSVDAIVTEPYLGPIRISNSKIQIQNLISDLSSLYLKAFREFKKILKPDGRVVIILPIFKYSNRKPIILSEIILDKIKEMGWQIEIPISEDLRENPIIEITSSGSIIYQRANQKVLREIFIFKL